jgi:hypothetical protein
MVNLKWLFPAGAALALGVLNGMGEAAGQLITRFFAWIF